jgi:hypothetical protein
MQTTFIYALKDPRTGKYRYVGKSDCPRRRYRAHLNRAVRPDSHRNSWLVGLKTAGLRPELEILDEVPVSSWEIHEQDYIRVFRALGFALVNGTGGGGGVVATPAAREKMSQSHLGRRPSSHALAKRAEAIRARGPRADNKNGYKGVSVSSDGVRKKRWSVKIKVGSKLIRLGRFETAEEAAQVYNEAALKFFGPSAYQNEIWKK